MLCLSQGLKQKQEDLETLQHQKEGELQAMRERQEAELQVLSNLARFADVYCDLNTCVVSCTHHWSVQGLDCGESCMYPASEKESAHVPSDATSVRLFEESV